MSELRPPESEYRRYKYLLLPQTVPLIPGPWMATGLIASGAAVLLLMMIAELRVDLSSASLGFAAIALAAAASCYALRDAVGRPAQAVRDLIEGLSLFACVSLLGALATYPLAAESRGFVDPLLQRIDLALHFNWVRWYDVVAVHRHVQQLERAAYLSIFVTPAILLGVFAWQGRRAEARMFIATFWLAALITLTLFAFVPAEGPLVYLGNGVIPYMPVSALHQQQDILALREHLIHDVDLGSLHGLVGAPSFHSASAVLFIATAWRIRPLRWPIAALNIAMLLATPVEGTHYLIDMLAGGAVALIALVVMPMLVRTGFARFGEMRDPRSGRAIAE